MSFTKRQFLKTAAATVAAGALPAGGVLRSRAARADEPIKLGILHSLTGSIAIAEIGVTEAERLAIDEINASGGVMGRQLQAVVEDGASDNPTFAEKAQKLLVSDKCAAVFGCYTSASRKAVLPVFERYKGLLYYPTHDEGLEFSKNIIYTGADGVQCAFPAIDWLVKNRGKKFYLIGSDFIFPRTINRISRPTITKAGGTVVGEDYEPLGSTDFASFINKIKSAQPDSILSTIVGDSNVSFYKQLNSAGLTDIAKSIVALAVGEEEARGIGPENLVGVNSCMGYFQSVDSPESKKFSAAFKVKYGPTRVVGDVMECGYISVYLWKLAVEKAGSFDVEKVVAASSDLPFDAPEGKVKIHATNHRLWKHARIGTFRPDGQLDIVHETPLIEPVPFPKL
jgi:urea transport system substrate-binding protein